MTADARLIALCSTAMGSGKSTVARYLGQTYDFEIVSFATPIKNMIRVLLSAAGYCDLIVERFVTGEYKEHPIWEIGDFLPEYAIAMLDALGPLPAEVTDRAGAQASLIMWGLTHFRYGVTSRRLQQTLGTEWGRDSIHPDLWALIARDTVHCHRDAGRSVVIDDMRFPNEYDLVLAEGGEARRIVRPGAVVTSTHVSEGQLDGIHMPEIWNHVGLTDLHRAVDRSLFH